MGTRSLGAETTGCLQSRVPPAPRRCSGCLRAQHHIRHLAGLGGCSAKAKGARWSVSVWLLAFLFQNILYFYGRVLGGWVQRPWVPKPPVSPAGSAHPELEESPTARAGAREVQLSRALSTTPPCYQHCSGTAISRVIKSQGEGLFMPHVPAGACDLHFPCQRGGRASSKGGFRRPCSSREAWFAACSRRGIDLRCLVCA